MASNLGVTTAKLNASFRAARKTLALTRINRAVAAYAKGPYSSRGPADVLNGADGIFAQTNGSTIVAADVGDDRASGQVTVGVEGA